MRIKIFVLLFLLINFFAFSSDLTKVGVVNINEIYTRYIKDSADARQFDEYKKTIQEEISKRKIEIDQIEKKLIEARDDDNSELVVELESQLQIKKTNLQEYSKYKNQELNTWIARDATKENFANKLQEAIREVGLQNGYSVIFNSKDPNMIWNDQSVDITDLVIQSLMN